MRKSNVVNNNFQTLKSELDLVHGDAIRGGIRKRQPEVKEVAITDRGGTPPRCGGGRPLAVMPPMPRPTING